ncbi:ribose-5-phosphate isomerase A [Liquorilactobacillus capillatus]|nr:ribose-5-phosphate isomerase A [Liquorilactobacillus capillatus]
METIIDVALNMLRPHMTVSLGGGSNVTKLACRIAETRNLPLTICTPSELTELKCQELGLTVKTLSQIGKLDLAFDGCDSVDYQLNLLKSGGGIHTSEKIYAQTAVNYIILAPAAKVTPLLNHHIPLTLEVITAAIPQVLQFTTRLGLRAVQRSGGGIASWARTPDGNQLIDCYAASWQNINELQTQLSQFNGVVSTSYFHQLASAIITDLGDKTSLITKGELA